MLFRRTGGAKKRGGHGRTSRNPAYSAGCGQLFLARRTAYESVGGHREIRTSLHDGIALPRAFRNAERATDLGDATDLAVCRMYRSASEVWYGLAKNAREGLAAPRLIVPATLMLLAGQVLPLVLLIGILIRFAATVEVTGTPLGLSMSIFENSGASTALTLAAFGTIALYYPRLDGVRRFEQSRLGAILHPLGIAVLLAIQWYATAKALIGKPSGWKGRTYP